jgi:hypothetical protein
MGTFSKTRSTPPGIGREDSPAYWFGQDENGNSFNYIRGDTSGIIAASFVDMTTVLVFQFGTGFDGSPIVVTTPSENFPAFGEPMVLEGGGNAARALQVKEESTTVTRPNSTPVLCAGKATSSQDQSSRKLENDQEGNLDVMVVWTKKTECDNVNLSNCNSMIGTTSYNAMKALIELALKETNTAYVESGVHTQPNLVHSYREESYVEAPFLGFNAFDMALLAHITTTAAWDGVVDNVHALRDRYGADIVAFIIDNPALCGKAWGGPIASFMFSVTAWDCATGVYAFGRDIG